MSLIRRQQVAFVYLLCIVLTGCADSSPVNLGQSNSKWDFDHKLQYKQTQFDENNFQLEVIPNNKVSFGKLSAFLLRRGYDLCGTYGYKLELITGVKSFDYSRASPNLIMPNLKANLQCPVQSKL